jgi:2-polyprenyl-3-methyl-5-hydroxy-6-metoxy-1,4-benzoquinol methylase
VDDVAVTEPRAEHWDDVYSSKRTDEVSWFQSEPEESLRHITSVASPESSVVDVGAGASVLVDRLLDLGFHDLTVVDISSQALDVVRDRLGDKAVDVTFTCSDVLHWLPRRTFGVWHDRAVFHFLTRDEDRDRYVASAASSIEEGGHLVLSTFAPDGPTHCSGLEVARYDVAGLCEVFGPAFTLVSSDREEHRTPWDAVQPFTWVVLRRTQR